MGQSVAELTENQIETIKEADLIRSRNIDFFKDFHKPIYEQFKDYKLQSLKINFNTRINQFDILKNGQSLYANAPLAHAREELSDFFGKFGPGKKLITIPPPFTGYTLPRIFHSSCTDIINSSPLKQGMYRGYNIENFYPLVAFHGIGAGYHIKEFLTDNTVINAIIVEPDPDFFAASLYIIDWSEFLTPFIEDKDRSVHFLIGPFDDDRRILAHEFRYLSSHCPLYPLTTYFINHLNQPVFTELTKKINEDTHAFTTIWGFYDDEIYQLNNCLHNLHKSHKIIKPNLTELRELPIFIIGGGPSLDDRIQQVIANKDKSLIVSCGTAIHSLYHYGIKPDLHIELESHLVTLTSLNELDDPEWLSSIPIIGPAQLPPRVFDLFEKKAIYFKGESVTNFLFGNIDSAIDRGTPTCTNAALAIFLHWGFSNIYLFGVDMGYKNTEVHHAKGSVYYKTEDEILGTGSKVDHEATITIKDVHDQPMKTKPLLYTAKRTIDTCAIAYKKTSSIHNCSDGAKLFDTNWIPNGSLDLSITPDQGISMKQMFIDRQFDSNENSIEKDLILKRIDVLDHNIEELSRYINSELKSIENTLYSLTVIVNRISTFLEKRIKPELPSFYFFIRGSIWHLLYIGYSHAFSIDDKNEREQWIQRWKVMSSETITEISKHFKRVVYKEFNIETDSWMWTSTSEPE